MAGRSLMRCTEGDPKYWPTSLKLGVLINLCLYVFIGNMFQAGLSTAFVPLAMEFHVEVVELTEQLSWVVLLFGISNFIWMPTALCIGKRPVILVSMVIFLAGCIWGVYASSNGELLGSRIFGSFGGGSIETLGPAIIADLFFERNFAAAMAFFAFALSAGTQFGPLFAGYLVESRGWRWFNILCAILAGINLAFSLVLLPETTYRRAGYAGETAADLDHDIKADAIEPRDRHVEKADGTQSTVIAHQDLNPPYAGNFLQDLVTFQDRGLEPQGFRKWPQRFIAPFKFFLSPQALFASFSFGAMIGGVVMISGTAPQILAPPPYLFTPSKLGLTNMASFVGCVLAFPIAGPLTDLISLRLTRRAGVHKPEHRIPALIIPFLISPPGLFVYGWALANYKNYYTAGVGFAMQAAGLVLVPSVVLSYVVDAYPNMSGESLVLVNAIKNSVAFGLTYAIPVWYRSQGLEKMLQELAGVQWGILALAFPVFFAGPWLRAKMAGFVN